MQPTTAIKTTLVGLFVIASLFTCRFADAKQVFVGQLTPLSILASVVTPAPVVSKRFGVSGLTNPSISRIPISDARRVGDLFSILFGGVTLWEQSSRSYLLQLAPIVKCRGMIVGLGLKLGRF